MKFACFLISPMLCDFTLFYRQMTHDIDYATFLTPDSEKVQPKLINSERTKLMMQRQLAERLRQEVENLAGTKKQHGTVRIAKLAKPFRPTNPPRKYKDTLDETKINKFPTKFFRQNRFPTKLLKCELDYFLTILNLKSLK